MPRQRRHNPPDTEQLEPMLEDTPRPSDADAVVYPRRRNQARALRDAALNALPDTARAVEGPTFDDDTECFRLDQDTSCLRYILRGKTLGNLYDGSLGEITFNLEMPRTLEEAEAQGGCVDLRGYVRGPKGNNPAEWAQWYMNQEQQRRLDELTARYKAEFEENQFSCVGPLADYQKVADAQCEEPAMFRSYNPFDAYVAAREAEGARSLAAAEQALNPYGGYLGEDGDADVSYGPYLEIEPYITPGERVNEYLQRVYNDATITDAEMLQIAQLLEQRPQLRQSPYSGDTPGTRDPIIAGAGFGATLCMSYYPCTNDNSCRGVCRLDPCIYYEDSCGGTVYIHPPGIAYYEPAGNEVVGWGDQNKGDLFQARMDRCYFECIRRRREANPSMNPPLTEDEIRELCEPERCLPAYCLDHHLASPDWDFSITSDNPRDALAGRSDADICRVAWVLANGWGVDDNDIEWWEAMTGSILPNNGYGSAPLSVPNDTCDGRYGNWRGKPCAFARIVTQMAVWAVQSEAINKVATGGIFVIICPPFAQNPGNYTMGQGPFRETLDRAFKNLVDGAFAYAEESDCLDRIGENADDYFEGPTVISEYPTGDLEKGLSAITPYPPRSLRDLNLPVVSNCNADAQSISACATDTQHLFWTAIPNEVRVVCGRVLVGPFRLHSTVGSVNSPKWEIKNTCGCNESATNPEYDETSTRCAPGGDWYHTMHCSRLFSFTDYCANPICCDAGSFDAGVKLPDEPCLDTDFYVAARITGRYMCFTLCAEIQYKQIEVLMFPNARQSIGARCPNAAINPEVACVCVCVETPQEEPAPDLFPPPAIFPPPPEPLRIPTPQQVMPQPFLIAPPPPPRPPRPPEFPPPIVIPPPPPPPPMPPRVVQPVIIPPPAPPLPPERMPPCDPIIVTPPPPCPTLPEIPPPAPVIVAPPVNLRESVILPPMPPLPPSMRGARPARLPRGVSPQETRPPWPPRPVGPINGAPPPMPGYEAPPIPGMPPPWPVTPPPTKR
ncbi:MAG: thioester domain-containing protein [Oscillospiraceae bacterium]|nr:thioester domain-containing protein [Oscillospiraceae bacterium]